MKPINENRLAQRLWRGNRGRAIAQALRNKLAREALEVAQVQYKIDQKGDLG